MDSPLRNYILEKTQPLLPFLKKIKLTPNLITTYGILMNAFAVLNLLDGEFALFIMLFATSYICDLIDGAFARKYNMETSVGALYDRIADWIKIVTVVYATYVIYKKKIDYTILLFIITILILCNINYSLKLLNNQHEIKLKTDIGSKAQLLWVSLYSKIPENKQKKIANVTRFFDETMIMLYTIGIIVYLHYKN